MDTWPVAPVQRPGDGEDEDEEMHFRLPEASAARSALFSRARQEVGIPARPASARPVVDAGARPTRRPSTAGQTRVERNPSTSGRFLPYGLVDDRPERPDARPEAEREEWSRADDTRAAPLGHWSAESQSSE